MPQDWKKIKFQKKASSFSMYKLKKHLKLLSFFSNNKKNTLKAFWLQHGNLNRKAFHDIINVRLPDFLRQHLLILVNSLHNRRRLTLNVSVRRKDFLLCAKWEFPPNASLLPSRRPTKHGTKEEEKNRRGKEEQEISDSLCL